MKGGEIADQDEVVFDTVTDILQRIAVVQDGEVIADMTLPSDMTLKGGLAVPFKIACTVGRARGKPSEANEEAEALT